MNSKISRELAALQRMSVGELQAKYTEVFGEATNGRNKAWLQKRIAWRIQANAFGGLTDRASKRARELANESDLRVTAPQTASESESLLSSKQPVKRLRPQDDRLPPVGDYVTRVYKNAEHIVQITHEGFEYEGKNYKTLTAIAKRITGQHWNGFRFFNLTPAKASS